MKLVNESEELSDAELIARWKAQREYPASLCTFFL